MHPQQDWPSSGPSSKGSKHSAPGGCVSSLTLKGLQALVQAHGCPCCTEGSDPHAPPTPLHLPKSGPWVEGQGGETASAVGVKDVEVGCMQKCPKGEVKAWCWPAPRKSPGDLIRAQAGAGHQAGTPASHSWWPQPQATTTTVAPGTETWTARERASWGLSWPLLPPAGSFFYGQGREEDGKGVSPANSIESEET